MRRLLAAAIVLGTTLGTSGLALAQAYPDTAYAPAPGPYYQPYPRATAYPPPPVYQTVPYQDPHSGGGASRAYSYWGAQKSN